MSLVIEQVGVTLLAILNTKKKNFLRFHLEISYFYLKIILLGKKANPELTNLEILVYKTQPEINVKS